MAGSVKLVTFDVGMTLLNSYPGVPEVFTRVAQRMGYPVELEDAREGLKDCEAFYMQEYMRDGDFWCVHERAVQIWLDIYTLMARQCGLKGDVSDLAQAVYDEFLDPACWKVYPDVEPCLKELVRHGCELAVISNWDATLEQHLRSIGLLPYFSDVFASAVVGYRKPNRAIFEIALERMRAKPEETVHVGDLEEADGAAADAGIRPIIIDRHHRIAESRFEVVHSLTEIPPLLFGA